MLRPPCSISAVCKLLSVDTNCVCIHCKTTLPWQNDANWFECKWGFVRQRLFLPPALCKIMVGLYPRELFWLCTLVGMLFPKDRDQMWYGNLLGKRPSLNSPWCYGLDVTGQISKAPSTLLSSKIGNIQFLNPHCMNTWKADVQTHERLMFRSKENKCYLSIWNVTLEYFLFALIFVSFGKNWN